MPTVEPRWLDCWELREGREYVYTDHSQLWTTHLGLDGNRYRTFDIDHGPIVWHNQNTP